MLSETKDVDKLAAFKREVERNAKLAPVLASAFHRRPQGAFAMSPRAIELEGAVRDVMSGARQAMRATAEALGTVPPHAEVDALLKAVQAGRLHGCSNGQHNLSLKVLADAGAKIDWLSQQAASSKPTGDAAAVAVGRQVAMTMPFLTMAYAALHPWDDSVRQTFDLVMAAMARASPARRRTPPAGETRTQTSPRRSYRRAGVPCPTRPRRLGRLSTPCSPRGRAPPRLGRARRMPEARGP